MQRSVFSRTVCCAIHDVVCCSPDRRCVFLVPDQMTSTGDDRPRVGTANGLQSHCGKQLRETSLSTETLGELGPECGFSAQAEAFCERA